MSNCGIYKLTCKINNRMYIGSSSNLRHRKNQHYSSLNKNESHNLELQNDYNLFGRAGFSFEVLEYCSIDKLLEIEKEYLNKYSNLNLYNIIGTDKKKKEMSDETKQKLRDLHKGKKKSQESLNKRSRARLKLTWKQCLEIEELLAEPTDELIKDKFKRIGDLYNVSDGMIGKVRSKTYTLYIKPELR